MEMTEEDPPSVSDMHIHAYTPAHVHTLTLAHIQTYAIHTDIDYEIYLLCLFLVSQSVDFY